MTSDDEDDALRARLDKLADDLKSVKPKPPPASVIKPGSAGAAWSLGVKAGSEFIAATVIGGAMGYGLDWLLHSKPAFTILFFLLGVAAGVWGVVRSTSPKGGR